MRAFEQAPTHSTGKSNVFKLKTYHGLPKGLKQKVNARIGIMELATWSLFTLKPKILK